MSVDVPNTTKELIESGLRLVPEIAPGPERSPIEKQFINFIFLKVDPDWRKLDESAKAAYKSEFCTVFDRFRDRFLLFTYSLVGFDSKADLMFWRVGNSLDAVQEMTASLFATGLGTFIETTDTYLSVTKRMMFTDAPSEDRRRVHAGSAKYHFVYPCAKHAEWYQMPVEQRDQMIEESFMVGMKFPNIKIHLTHAFGFTEHDYLISFETDEPKDFLALAEELRHTSASKFTLRGMPVYTCRQRSLSDCLDALG